MSSKRITNIIMIVLSVAWFLIGWRVREFFLSEDIRLLEQERQIILRYYNGDTPSSRELTYAAMRGMLQSLEDPHSAFFRPEIVARDMEKRHGQYGGTGARAEEHDGDIVIANVRPDSAADRVGLQTGDIILEADGWDLTELSYTEAGVIVLGEPGTPLHVKVQRGDEILEFDLKREAPQTVETRMIDEDIAYLHLPHFYLNTPEEVKQGLDELWTHNPRGFIWDLRGNQGGAVTATIEIIDHFVDGGVLLYAEEKDGKLTPAYIPEGGMATEIPLVVLIDRYTYSAGETTAAAIKDLGRGLLVGETTYGKGTINKLFPLIDSSVMEMTVARWLSPARKWYGDTGVPPDVTLVDNPDTEEDEVLDYAVTRLRQQ